MSDIIMSYELNGMGTMLAKRGLQPNGAAQLMLSNEVARHCDPYVPMSGGSSAHMKNQRRVEPDGVVYPGPYARYLYFGKVMVGRAPKKVTDRDLKYHGAPKRGAFWDKRMWKDKKHVILKSVAAMAGGRI